MSELVLKTKKLIFYDFKMLYLLLRTLIDFKDNRRKLTNFSEPTKPIFCLKIDIIGPY